KAGDKFLAAAYGKSSQNAVFIDTTGRSYSLAAHSLPSARGQGEPLTGRLTPPAGANFMATLIGNDNEQYLLSTDAGYGFIGTLADMQSKNKAGKNLITVPDNARILNPAKITDPDNSWIAAVSNQGRLLVFPAADLPQMARGKGNKMIGIPTEAASKREELMIAAVAFSKDDTLLVYSGKRHLNMKFADLEHYLGERGRRGNKLPRGFQNVDAMEVVRKDCPAGQCPLTGTLARISAIIPPSFFLPAGFVMSVTATVSETLYPGYAQTFTVEKVLFEIKTEHQHLQIIETPFMGR